MMLTTRDISDHVAQIESKLNSIENGNGRTEAVGTPQGQADALADVAWRLGVLREQYRRQPGSMSAAVPALSRARARFDALLAARVSEIADRFHAVNEALRRLEAERDVWRDTLIRLAGQMQRREIIGRSAVVAVRPTRTLTVPQQNTPQREQLEQTLRDGGCWEQVSSLSRARLQQAFEDGKLSPEVAGAVGQLCPVTASFAVSSRPAGGAAR